MRSPAKTTVLATLAIAVLIMLPPGFSPVKGGLAEDEPSTLTIGFTKPVDSLNPFIGISEAARLFYGLVYEGLQGVGNDMEPVPNLATSWWIVPDSVIGTGEPYGSVWQYNLSQNASWHDGEVFTAEDVVFTVNMIAANYSDLWAPQPYSYFIGRAEAITQYSVMIHFADRKTGDPMPVSFGDSLLFPIMPKHLLSNMSSSDLGFKWVGTYGWLSTPLVGTGPFMAQPGLYKDWLESDVIRLVRNPYHHAEADYGKKIQFDRLVLKCFDNETDLVAGLKSNTVDVAGMSVDGYAEIRGEVLNGSLPRIQTFSGLACSQKLVYVSWTAGSPVWGGYSSNPSTRDPVIRRAMAMATDRESVAGDIYHGLAEKGSTVISRISPWHYEPSSMEEFAYDPEAAKELLESNGYVDVDADGIREATEASPSVVLDYVSEGEHLQYEMIVDGRDPCLKETAMYLRTEWADVGVDLTLHYLDAWYLQETLCPYGGDLGLLYSETDPDPNMILFTQSSRAVAGWSDTSYMNESYDQSYNTTVTDLTDAERSAEVDECQRIHYHDQSYLVLAYVNENYAWSTGNFTGWGNWSAQPGRSLEGVWGANPLFFDLTPRDSTRGMVELVLITGVVLAAAIAIVVAFVLIRRRKQTAS